MSACGSLPRKPVPKAQAMTGQIPDMQGIRAFGLVHSPEFQRDIQQSVHDEDEDAYCSGSGKSRVYCALAISGGGGFGAFGAGYLYGWSASGQRPNFKLVTGVSTGALIGIFAFLGPDYDEQLKESYTTISDKDIFRSRGLLNAIADESFTDSRPLTNMIESFVDQDLLNQIATVHASGRRFYVGTTNMDTQKFVVWNMGAIASSGAPGALELFRKVILASASVPTVFPPVFIKVMVDGVQYDEMHADGGVLSQVFFHANVVDLDAVEFPTELEAKKKEGKTSSKVSHVYVIRNGKIGSEIEPVKRNLKDITKRALSTMIKSMSVGDLFRMYEETQALGIGFNYVGMPRDFQWQAKDEFDRAEMNRLFDIGVDMGRSGQAWRETPPLVVQGRKSKQK